MSNAKKKKKSYHIVWYLGCWFLFLFLFLVLHDLAKLNDSCEQSPDFLTINAC